MDKPQHCTTCNRSLINLKGNVSFSCPQCNKSLLTRCFYCRRIAAKYTCPNCGFIGPN